jgi:AcrR family transcriptional regulator
MAPNARKRTQRERLLTGMVEATNRRGYAGASVSAVIGEAGVSRPTFYEYFADRDDCFRASVEDVQQELLGAVERALHGRPADEAAGGAIEAFVAYASAEPARARFLMGESMAGGEGALDARDRGIARIAEAIEGAQRAAARDAPLPDLDARVLIGTVYRMLATRLRRGEPAISRLTDELLAWLAAYQRPAAQRRWQALSPGVVPARSAHLPDIPIQQAPDALASGRPRLSEEQIAENHRLRILHATARMAGLKGYSATTVADITKLASVDARVFYRHFADKQEAFTTVHELGFQRVMDVTAKAFFAADGWPQRSWEAGRALTQVLQENPLVARVGFVEAYAVGPSATQRVEDSHIAFMFFLQEGLVHRVATSPPSRVAMEAVISAVFEVIYLQARAQGEPQIASMLEAIAHLWLTPFLGVEDADAFIESQR